MNIQKAREKFAEINLKEGFYTEEELSITNLGIFECTAAEQDWEKWWECLIYYVEPMLQAQKVAVHEGFVLVPKLSANFLFKIVPELGFKHQDQKDTVLYHLNYMASEFKESAKKFVEEDHVKQKAMIEAQEQVG